MGFVWNVLLSFDNEEWWEDGEDEPRKTCEPLERINQWIPHGRLVSPTKPTYAKGVGFGMDANLFGGGYKHFDIEGFIKVVEAQDWKDRANVHLWVKGAEEGMGEASFTPVKLRRRRMIRAKPKNRLRYHKDGAARMTRNNPPTWRRYADGSPCDLAGAWCPRVPRVRG